MALLDLVRRHIVGDPLRSPAALLQDPPDLYVGLVLDICLCCGELRAQCFLQAANSL